MRTNYVDDAVKQLIVRFHTNDPFYIARELKVHVRVVNMDISIGGFYRYLKRNQFIIINNRLRPPMKKFVVAHELGHAILHPKTSTFFLKDCTAYWVNKTEDDANEFATKLLISPFRNIELSKDKLVKKCGIPAEMKRFL
ncbi:MAG: ImmA/IrrE family metallo-endopeptidase [Sporolactobacillus sp.]|nr:ImmA/IrrE family metallo-endopeptidase [Sporolactobacillus sp.]